MRVAETKGLEYGKRNTDSLQMETKDRICIGALTEVEVPTQKLNGSFMRVLGVH